MAETDKDDLISIIDDDDREAEIPGILPLMPVRDIVVFTDMVLPLFVGREKSVRAVQEAVRQRNMRPAELETSIAMGLALGWLRAATASIWPCVLAHAIHNAASLALAG